MSKIWKLTRIEILEYALEGAVTKRGVQSGNMSFDEEQELDRDIDELKLRIKRYHESQDKQT